MRRTIELTGKAVYWLVTDPRKALFLVRRRLWPLLYPIVRRFDHDPPGKGAFLDFGSNYGQGIRYFTKLYPPDRYDYVLVEPNPACHASLERAATELRARGAGAKVLPNAVWISNEKLRLSIPPLADDPTSLGSSHMVSDTAGLHSFEVQGLDVGVLIDEMASYGHLVIKMDIEGAELEVLERIFSKASGLPYRLVLYVEFHSYYQEGAEKRASLVAERSLLNRIPENVVLREWH